MTDVQNRYHFNALIDALAARQTEDRFNKAIWQIGGGAPPLEMSTLRDEDGDPPVREVLAADVLNTAEQGRLPVLASLVGGADNPWVLQVNDLDANAAQLRLGGGVPVASEISDGLVALSAALGKPLRIYPHTQLAGLCRQIPRTSQFSFAWRAYLPRLDPVVCEQIRAYAAYREVNRPATDAGQPAAQTDDLTHLDRLEAESIFIMREALAQADNPVMLYSIGKDSSVMLHLAQKAFFPGPLPFPLLHIDTRWKFREMIRFRDMVASQTGSRLIVHTNPEAIERNVNPFDHGSAHHTDITKTEALKQALDAHRFDLSFGGARRDEERSRAKERVFSFRHQGHRWDPKSQRPELWRLFNARCRPGQSMRVFPLSNWTELDIWQYIYRERIPIVPLYFAASRPVVEKDGLLMMVDDARLPLTDQDKVRFRQVRFRTLGCYPLTGAIESDASTLEQVVLEVLRARSSEREGRAIDKDSSGSMERKKQEGYF